MKLYHGTKITNLQIENHMKSRYGFTAFFGALERDLAIKYAYHSFKKLGTGYLYSFEAPKPTEIINFEGKISHSLVFRNLIYKLQKENHKSILIENIIDYPTEELALYTTNTILIIFNLELITNLKMIGKY